jgi:5-hydroxyisourate hydrolase
MLALSSKVYTLLFAVQTLFWSTPKDIMGKLTTHVLDTANGCPAAGMAVALYRLDGATPTLIKQIALNHDGRSDGPLLDGASFVPGRYRLVFGVAAYFRSLGAALSDPPFLDEVPLDFGLATVGQHYHVPLLASPFAYSTYRGS